MKISSVAMSQDVPTASISSHALDITRGVPASGMQVLAWYSKNDTWVKIGDQ